MEHITLPESLRHQMIRHAKAAVPMEAVGIVGGRDGLARLVIELPNLAGRNEFFADPYAQFQAERRLSEENLQVIAIYHSHPNGGTDLSKADVTAAARWRCAQIVIVPEGGFEKEEYMSCYRVSNEHKVAEIKIRNIE